MSGRLFAELLGSLTEALEHVRGQRALRATVVRRKPRAKTRRRKRVKR